MESNNMNVWELNMMTPDYSVTISINVQTSFGQNLMFCKAQIIGTEIDKDQ